MALLDSLKKLFVTSKDLGAAKIEELKGKATPKVENTKEQARVVVDKIENATADIRESAHAFGEKVQTLGEDLVEKAQEKLDKLEASAENFVEDLNTKLQAKLPKTETVTDQAIAPVEQVEEKVTEAAKEPVNNAEEPNKKAKE